MVEFCSPTQQTSCHYQPQDYTDDYNNTNLLCSTFFPTLSNNHFQFCEKNAAMKSARNRSNAVKQISPTCRIIPDSLKCDSTHLYKRLHLLKFSIHFTKLKRDEPGLMGRSTVLLKRKEKGESVH